MTIVQTPSRSSRHALRLQASHVAPSSRFIALDKKGAALPEAMFGVEVLRPQGWKPLTVPLGRRVRTFRSIAEAMDACILHWRKTGQGARPFSLRHR